MPQNIQNLDVGQLEHFLRCLNVKHAKRLQTPSAHGSLACERRRISGCHLVLPKNNVCEPEPGNDFCDVMTFVSP